MNTVETTTRQKRDSKSKSFLVRLTMQDYNLFTQQAQESNLTRSKLLRLYIRNKKLNATLALLNKSIHFNNTMLLEISRVAGNINQIAYHLNANALQEKNNKAYKQNTNNTSDTSIKQEALHNFLTQSNSAKEIFAKFHSLAKANKEKLEKLYQ